MKTKNILFTILLLVAILGSSFLTVIVKAETYSPAIFKTTSFNAFQGETFATTLYLEADSNLIDYQIQLKYDTSLVELISAEESDGLVGSLEITKKANGILHLSYTRTSSNLTNKTDFVNLVFKVDKNTSEGNYTYLAIDNSYATEAHTMVNNDLYALPITSAFDDLKIFQAGDVNLDGVVSIADVTYLRQFLASIRTLSDYQLKFADAYFDSNVSISDAVRIQQSLANNGIVLGNRVNVIFYDKDKKLIIKKSVIVGENLTNIPTLPVISGFFDGRWSSTQDTYSEVSFTNIQNTMSVYALYKQDASPAITFYKDRLRSTYYSNNVLSGNLALISDMTYEGVYNSKIFWSSSNSATLNATTGVFSKPIYDSSVTLTATIISYHNGLIEAQDSIKFDYSVVGEFQCPPKAEIKGYLDNLFGSSIDENIWLPNKVTNEDVKNVNKKYEVRISWAVIGNDGNEYGISQISRTAYEQNVTLVATVTFNGVPIEGDGKIYFDNIILSPITEKEVRTYIIDQIAGNMGVSLSTDEILWDNDTKYNASVRWISKNSNVATVAANKVTISNVAVNGAALPMVAEVTYSSGKGAVTFELAYTVSVITDNKRLVPGTNIDEKLFDALKTATGVYGSLTTDALKDTKFVYLDLSGYPEITDLSGLTYCTNLRVLNISGLRIAKGLNEIASLSKLEALIAKNCGFTTLSDGGIPILKDMINLQILDLSNNNFTSLSSVFATDRRYGKLLELYLNDNQLNDISALTCAPFLRFLVLSHNQLENDDLLGFNNFKLLKFLSLADNKITSITNIKDNKTLLELRLQNNQISDVRDLRFLTYLQSLYLGNNNISNVFSGSVECNVSYLRYLTNLEILYLNDNNIENITALSVLSKLAALNVSNNKIQSLAFLSDKRTSMLELYAENNDIQTFSFVKDLTNLKKLMLSGNMSTYESALPTYLAGLKELETLTLSGKDLRTISFLKEMTKLIRLDIANCNLPSYLTVSANVTGEKVLVVNSYIDNISYIKGLSNTLRFLDVSNNGLAYNSNDMMEYLNQNGNAYNFDAVTFTGNVPLKFDALYELTNLTTLYADNVKGTVNAPALFSLMSEIRYISLENCGVSEAAWLSKFRNLVHVDLAGNNINTFDLGNYISTRSRETLQYLYIDSKVPCEFVNSYITFDGNVLKELSMKNSLISEINYLPDMPNIEYLNLSNSKITDLKGSNPDFYEKFTIERFTTLKTIDVSGVQADISPLKALSNLQTVYGIGTGQDKAFYESNVNALYALHNRGVDCYLYDYATKYQPVAITEGTEILKQLPNLNCDIKVAANNVLSDNNPILPDEINDFKITWTLSNTSNYEIVNHQLSVKNYTNIDDEALTLTAQTTVYPNQSPVTRTFTINTEVLRVDKQYLDINRTGIGDSLARGAIFTYDVKVKAFATEGFSSPVLPVYSDIVGYEYSAVLKNGSASPVENILIIGSNHNYQINPLTEALEAVVTITIKISHLKNAESVNDYTITVPIKIATETFNIQYEANGGKVVNKSDGANITVKPYLWDTTLFDDLTVSRDGYTFVDWFTDTGLNTAFAQSKMPAANLVLYAKWQIKTYTVTFESNSGSAVASITAPFNSIVGKPIDPTRPIYLFVNWYKDIELTTLWNFATDVIYGDTTIYAKWIPDQYPVTYDPNGGTGGVTQIVTYGSVLTPPDNPVRTGYTFGGWYKESSCTNIWNLSNDTITSATTLYAKWNVNTYIISFNANGGSVPTQSKNIVYATTYGYTGTLPTASKTWNTFLGWFTDASGGTKIIDTTVMSTAVNHTLYAHWLQITCTIPDFRDWYLDNYRAWITSNGLNYSETSQFDYTKAYGICRSNDKVGQSIAQGSGTTISFNYSKGTKAIAVNDWIDFDGGMLYVASTGTSGIWKDGSSINGQFRVTDPLTNGRIGLAFWGESYRYGWANASLVHQRTN